MQQQSAEVLGAAAESRGAWCSSREQREGSREVGYAWLDWKVGAVTIILTVMD